MIEKINTWNLTIEEKIQSIKNQINFENIKNWRWNLPPFYSRSLNDLHQMVLSQVIPV